MEEMYGYIWASSRDQNDDRQRIALRDMGVLEKEEDNTPAGGGCLWYAGRNVLWESQKV